MGYGTKAIDSKNEVIYNRPFDGSLKTMRYRSKEVLDKRDKVLREKRERLYHWHKYFAWFPVMCLDTNGVYESLAWLESVERRGSREVSNGRFYWKWFYRTLNNSEFIQTSEKTSCGNCDKCKCPK